MFARLKTLNLALILWALVLAGSAVAQPAAPPTGHWVTGDDLGRVELRLDAPMDADRVQGTLSVFSPNRCRLPAAARDTDGWSKLCRIASQQQSPAYYRVMLERDARLPQSFGAVIDLPDGPHRLRVIPTDAALSVWFNKGDFLPQYFDNIQAYEQSGLDLRPMAAGAAPVPVAPDLTPAEDPRRNRPHRQYRNEGDFHSFVLALNQRNGRWDARLLVRIIGSDCPLPASGGTQSWEQACYAGYTGGPWAGGGASEIVGSLEEVPNRRLPTLRGVLTGDDGTSYLAIVVDSEDGASVMLQATGTATGQGSLDFVRSSDPVFAFTAEAGGLWNFTHPQDGTGLVTNYNITPIDARTLELEARFSAGQGACGGNDWLDQLCDILLKEGPAAGNATLRRQGNSNIYEGVITTRNGSGEIASLHGGVRFEPRSLESATLAFRTGGNSSPAHWPLQRVGSVWQPVDFADSDGKGEDAIIDPAGQWIWPRPIARQSISIAVDFDSPDNGKLTGRFSTLAVRDAPWPGDLETEGMKRWDEKVDKDGPHFANGFSLNRDPADSNRYTGEFSIDPGFSMQVEVRPVGPAAVDIRIYYAAQENIADHPPLRFLPRSGSPIDLGPPPPPAPEDQPDNGPETGKIGPEGASDQAGPGVIDAGGASLCPGLKSIAGGAMADDTLARLLAPAGLAISGDGTPESCDEVSRLLALLGVTESTSPAWPEGEAAMSRLQGDDGSGPVVLVEGDGLGGQIVLRRSGTCPTTAPSQLCTLADAATAGALELTQVVGGPGAVYGLIEFDDTTYLFALKQRGSAHMFSIIDVVVDAATPLGPAREYGVRVDPVASGEGCAGMDGIRWERPRHPDGSPFAFCGRDGICFDDLPKVSGAAFCGQMIKAAQTFLEPACATSAPYTGTSLQFGSLGQPRNEAEARQQDELADITLSYLGTSDMERFHTVPFDTCEDCDVLETLVCVGNAPYGPLSSVTVEGNGPAPGR